MGAGFDPLVEIGGVFLHLMLDVNFLCLVAGEGGVDAGQDAGICPVLDFGLVQKIGGEMPVAEEKPVLTGGASAVSFSVEGTEGGDACPGPDHDDIFFRCR